MSSADHITAFGAIYEEHFGFVWAVLRRLGVGEVDLEDVVQEVFIVVHRRLHAFEARASVRTWLYAIAVRVYWNHARRRRNHPALAETSSSALQAVDGDPERFAERREAGGLLEELLGKLDPKKRTVFVLAELEGLTAPQIARITGANERTVYSRLRAARSSFEAGLARARAKERNDAIVGALTRNERPPAGAQQRTWAALLLQLGTEPAIPIAAAGLGATLKAGAVSLGLGLGALGVVYVATAPLRAAEPSVDAAVVVADARAIPRHVDPAREGTAAEVPQTEVPQTAIEQAPEVVASSPAPATSRRARSGREPVALEPAEDDLIRAELALLQRAREALRAGDPDRTLSLLDDHAKRFPDSTLARERDRTRVTALCRAGRSDDATAYAERHGLPTPACTSG